MCGEGARDESRAQQSEEAEIESAREKQARSTSIHEKAFQKCLN